MKSLSEIKSILASQKQMLKEKYGIREIGVFGSYTRGEQKIQSDIDILVKFDEDSNLTLLDFIQIENYLSDLLGVKVDLVMKKGLKPRLRERILSETVYV